MISSKETKIISEFNELGYKIMVLDGDYYVSKHCSSTGTYISEEGNLSKLKLKLEEFKGIVL